MLACRQSEAEGASTEGGANTTRLQPSFGRVLKDV